MEKTDQAVAKIIEAINALASQHAAAGVDLALTAIRAKAICECVIAVIFALICITQARKAISIAKINQDFGESPDFVSRIFLSFAISAVLLVWVPMRGTQTFITAIDPKLGLAMRVIEKVL